MKGPVKAGPFIDAIINIQKYRRIIQQFVVIRHIIKYNYIMAILYENIEKSRVAMCFKQLSLEHIKS